MDVSTQFTGNRCKVLWVDTVHGPHVAAVIYRELAERATSPTDLHYVCLDVLGANRGDFPWLATAS